MICVGLSHISLLNEKQFGKYIRLIEVSKFIKMFPIKRIVIFTLLSICVMTTKAKQSYIFLATGVEEIEAMATIDALRRAEIPVVAVAVDTTLQIKGATGQTIVADSLISDIDISAADWLIVPGGVPGAPNLHASKRVSEMLLAHYRKGGRIASICAGPAVVLAPLGILEGKKATCYPGLGGQINSGGGEYVEEKVVVAPNLITSEGPGTTLPFAIEIIRQTKGDETAKDIAASMIVSL